MDVIPIWHKYEEEQEPVVIRGPWMEPILKIYVEELEEEHARF